MIIGGSNQRADRLSDIPIFATCSRRQRRRIVSLSTCVEVRAGTVLVRADRPEREFLVVMSGAAVVWHRDGDTEELGPGAYFGESQLFGGEPQPETVVAGSDMMVLAMNRQEFHSPDFLIAPVLQAMLTSRLQRRPRLEVGRQPIGAGSCLEAALARPAAWV